MNCTEVKSLFSPYLDGAVTGAQMHAIGQHIQSCSHCAREYKLLVQTQNMLTSLGRVKAPSDLPLRLRVAISQEAAQARRPRFQGLRVRLENAINGFMVPATAGMVSAVIIFGILMGFVGLPDLGAMNNDVPLMLNTAPQLQSSVVGTGIGPINSDSLVIEAYVGADGRVQDFRVLSDPQESKDLLPQVKNMLILSTFRPATSFGRPMAGRTVLSFSKISVKG